MSELPICVVFGGSGFLGQRLCKRLVQSGYRVRSVSRAGRPRGETKSWWRLIEWVRADMGSETSRPALSGAEVLFHLASSTYPSTSNMDSAFDLESNVIGCIRMLKTAVECGIKRVIFVSSGGTVYGIPRQIPIPETHPTDPICSYGIHKLAVEKYLSMYRLLHGLSSIVLRVANMYGEFQDLDKPLGAVSHFVHRALSGSPIDVWGDGSVRRDYIYVEDVVDALLKATDYRRAETIFNIGSGQSVSLNELIELILERVGNRVPVNYSPGRNFDIPDNLLDISRASKELGWTPTTGLETGLNRLIASTAIRNIGRLGSRKKRYIGHTLPTSEHAA
jgi:UDP-glucose 4-epimerase